MSRTRATLALLALFTVLVAAGAAVTRTTSTEPGAAAGRTQRGDSLLGRWDTGPIPAAKIRSALIRAGFTPSAVARFFRVFQIGKALEFEYVFYRKDGTLFQLRRAWDPSSGGRGQPGDRGPCRLLARHRFVVSDVGPATDGIHATFAYAVNADRLRLRFSGLVVPIREAQVLYDRMMLTATTSRPYKRTG